MHNTPNLSEIPEISKLELQKLMIVGTHLHQWQGVHSSDLSKIMQEQGFVQLDPLNPAGRNHDHFFLARLPNYTCGLLENTCYPQSEVFEAYFHSLDVIHRDFISLFYLPNAREHLWQRHQDQLNNIERNHPQLIEKVKKHIKENGPTGTEEMKRWGKIAKGQRKWSPDLYSANLLELLAHIGELSVVKRDENFRKYYDFTETYFPEINLQRSKMPSNELWNKRFSMYLHSFPIVDSKITIGKENKLRLPRGKSSWIARLDHDLSQYLNSKKKGEEARYNPNLVYFKSHKRLYFVPQNWKNLLDSSIDDNMRVIAPLDPLIWDRGLIQNIFDFNYRWEVYTPVLKRQWGYYVYPLLYKGKFVGRLEAKMPKSSNILSFTNFLPEKGLKINNTLKIKFDELIKRWQQMVSAKSIQFDNSFSKLI